MLILVGMFLRLGSTKNKNFFFSSDSLPLFFHTKEEEIKLLVEWASENAHTKEEIKFLVERASESAHTKGKEIKLLVEWTS